MYKSKKAARAAVAAVLVAGLALAPASALAKTSATDVADAPVTVTGVNDGDTVKFYRIFDADIDAANNLAYTTEVAGLPAEYDTAAKVAGEKDGRKVADAIAPTVTAGAAAYTAEAAGGKATQSLDSGLYLVTVTTTSGKTKVYQTMLVNASPVVADGAYAPAALGSLAAKSQDVPAPEKKVVSADGAASGKLTDTYSVGDKAAFRIDATTPSYPSNATHAAYSVTDVPEAGLSLNKDSIKVYDGDGYKNPVEAKNYEVAYNADGGFTVKFTWEYLKDHAGKKVRIEYKADVVAINVETGKVGNKAYGTFTPNPYEDKEVSTEPADPQIQTYGFVFKKVTPTGDVLPGAEFTITNADGPVTYVDAAGVKHADGKVVSDANGYVHVNGLEAGAYTVTETGVPAGFQKVEPFVITLDESDKGDSPATPNVTEKNFDVNTADVTDPRQGQLPTTGGAGTAALTAGGILLVAGGVVVVFRSRKQN